MSLHYSKTEVPFDAGQPTRDFCRTLSVPLKTSFFFTLDASKAMCVQRNGLAYIQMAAKEGQNIQINIIETMSETAVPAANNTDSIQHGHIVDAGVEETFAYAMNDRGQMEAGYRSNSHTVTLVLNKPVNNFIVTYHGRYHHALPMPSRHCSRWNR